MIILGSYGLSYSETRKKIDNYMENKNGRVLIIPIASWYDIGVQEKNYAVSLGFEANNVTVFDNANAANIMKTDYDYILVPGGNTFKLLYYVKQYGLDEYIRQQIGKGSVYFGFSAGAYLACRNIEYVKCFDDNNHISNGDFSALGLTEKYVLCHFNTRGFEEIKMCRDFIGTEPELVTINDEDIVAL